VVAFAIVLAGYVFTLAPTVTFWDAGEFIATSHILGVPHPPGTPLFVMLGHTWDALIPFLPTAYKLNLMNAIASAGASGFLFLFMHAALTKGAEGMDEATARVFVIGGAFASTLCTAFAFTVWQVSIDTGKVYPVAMLLIAFSIWLAWLWRRERGGERGAHFVLLIIYMLGLSLGNHLIGLLGGPALFAFMYWVLRSDPAPQPAERQAQWAQLGVAVALWIALVGLSIGSSGRWILILGLLLYAGATVWAFRARTGLFGVAALIVAALGVSTYAFLYIRAGLHPFINEANASTLKNLWAVIGREQYPPRSPFDNPMFESSRAGYHNPGRFFQPYSADDPTAAYFTLRIIGLQFLNWIQYFDWQWSNSLMTGTSLLAPARLPFTIAFAALGILGAQEHKKWDKASYLLIGTLFLTTGLGLVVYLNFKPGYSIGLASFPGSENHEVRERDYFFTISFLMWGLWAGLGIAALFQRLRARVGSAGRASPVLLIALLPAILNFTAANRRFGPAARLAHDFAYDLLQSVEPYGILFTNGDNDTFPLWYIQEVEHVRQDVVVVNESLVNTDWYIRQLRDNPARPYQPDSTAIALYGDSASAGPPPACSPQWADTLDAWSRAADRRPPDRSRGMPLCLHHLTDATINTLEPRLLDRPIYFRAGPIEHTYPVNTPLYVNNLMTLLLIQENMGRRPLYFAITAGSGARMQLDRYMIERALAYKLTPDTVRAGPNLAENPLFGPNDPLVDINWTQRLAHGAYRYARLFQAPELQLDPTDDNIATNLALPIWTLGMVALQRNDLQTALRELNQVEHLMPTNPSVHQLLQQLHALAAMPAALRDTGAARHDTTAARHDSAGRPRASP